MGQIILTLGVLASLVIGYIFPIIPPIPKDVQQEVANQENFLHKLTEYTERIGLRNGISFDNKILGTFGSPGDRLRYLGGQKYRLGGAGASTSDTTVTLQSFTLPVSGTEIAMSDFGGDIGYATLDPGTSRQEFISFTGVTQSGTDTTATLTGITRGLSPNYPYTTDTTNYAKTHAGGSIVIISNPPQLYDEFANKRNKETITGQWDFTTAPVLFASSTLYYTTLPTISSSTQLTTKDYVDGVALVGAPLAASTSISGIARPGEPIELASSSNPLLTVHGTTSPFFLSSINTTADPIPLRDNATNTWYGVITNSDLTISNQFFATTVEDAYRWGGLATFGELGSWQGFGLGTDTPSIANFLSSKGNILVGATTTTGALIATTTSIMIGGVRYSFPPAQATTSPAYLVNDNSGKLTWDRGPVISYVMPQYLATTTGTLILNTNTVATYSLFTIPAPFSLSSITISVTSVGTSGTLDLGLYRVSGEDVVKVIDVITGTISATGIVTTSTTTTALLPGTYYFGVQSVGSANIGIHSRSWSTDTEELENFDQPAGFPFWSVQETGLEAGVLPDTLNESANSATEQVMFRLDS